MNDFGDFWIRDGWNDEWIVKTRLIASLREMLWIPVLAEMTKQNIPLHWRGTPLGGGWFVDFELME
jgi:hypothetical protein